MITTIGPYRKDHVRLDVMDDDMIEVENLVPGINVIVHKVRKNDISIEVIETATIHETMTVYDGPDICNLWPQLMALAGQREAERYQKVLDVLKLNGLL